MFEWWRQITYPRYERRVGASDDLAVFERLVDGPWTPAMVARMPIEVLLAGPKLGGISPETRKVIDLEVARRMQAPSAYVGYLIGIAGVLVAIFD
jgi:hypothetical protein